MSHGQKPALYNTYLYPIGSKSWGGHFVEVVSQILVNMFKYKAQSHLCVITSTWDHVQ